MPGDIIAALSQAGIPLLTPQDADFAPTLNSYTGIHDAKPTVVTLPTTAEQVATIVGLCIETDSDVVVRGRGHDIYGRFTAPGAVSIDLRKLDSVTVSGDKSTASVGGGVTASRVLEELEKHGLQVPVGSCGSVGFTSWSLVGGLGPYMQSYGLGADQIVGAKVVNSQGMLVDADEKLLTGLRGGGGSLCVVVELTVKAYPLQKVRANVETHPMAHLKSNNAERSKQECWLLTRPILPRASRRFSTVTIPCARLIRTRYPHICPSCPSFSGYQG